VARARRKRPKPGIARHPIFVALDREYIASAKEAADVALAAGGHDRLLPAITRAADRARLDEALQARRMLMLAAAGHQAAALDLYQAIRTRLSTELGIDPGPELTTARDWVLRAQTSAPPAGLAPRPAGSGVPAAREAAGHRPAQLPADLPTFTGRRAELAAAMALHAEESVSPGTVVISAIGGMAGIGKTTLAVHWAHQVAHRFPDGQLYLNLRGFDPGGHVMNPGEALHALLGALGVAEQDIPAAIDRRSAMFRSLTADRRLLILLDNARDANQVRPLLPGGGGCLVIVTCRSELPGLVATEGAHPMTLDLFSPAEARDFLRRRLGAPKVASDRKAVNDIVTLCAGLPLALAIVAARALLHPEFALSAVAHELREAHGGLDGFAGPEAAVNARAAFSPSYDMLSPDAARLFRLLSVHPGPDVTTPVAASIAGVTPKQVRLRLSELTAAHLIKEHAPGRYACHDLLRAYAAELAANHDDEPRAAIRRMVDHYLHTGHRAAMLLSPSREPIPLPLPEPDVTPGHLAGYEQALSWFVDEYPALLAILQGISGYGLDRQAWQLAWTLDTFQSRQGRLHDHVATRRTALAAAQRLSEPTTQADAHRDLGHALSRAGDSDEARAHFTLALELYDALGNPNGQAHVHRGIGFTYLQEGGYATTLRHCQRAGELYRAAGNQIGWAKALNETGYMQAQLGDHQSALDRCQKALALFTELGDGHGRAACMDSLGYVHLNLGDHRNAVTLYRQAAVLFGQLGDRHGEASALIGLGDAHRGTGDRERARACWRNGLKILMDLNHPDVHTVRARLSEVIKRRLP